MHVVLIFDEKVYIADGVGDEAYKKLYKMVLPPISLSFEGFKEDIKLGHLSIFDVSEVHWSDE